MKKKLIIGGVGLVAVAALYFTGASIDWGNVIKLLIEGNIVPLCEQIVNG